MCWRLCNRPNCGSSEKQDFPSRSNPTPPLAAWVTLKSFPKYLLSLCCSGCQTTTAFCWGSSGNKGQRETQISPRSTPTCSTPGKPSTMEHISSWLPNLRIDFLPHLQLPDKCCVFVSTMKFLMPLAPGDNTVDHVDIMGPRHQQTIWLYKDSITVETGGLLLTTQVRVSLQYHIQSNSASILKFIETHL